MDGPKPLAESDAHVRVYKTQVKPRSRSSSTSRVPSFHIVLNTRYIDKFGLWDLRH